MIFYASEFIFSIIEVADGLKIRSVNFSQPYLLLVFP